MQFHQLKPNHPHRQSRQVGRGGKRGKTSGRGTKGQKARAGRKIRPEVRDVIKRLPKLRGRGKHSEKSIAVRPATVSLRAVAARFKRGEIVSPRELVLKGIIKTDSGRLPHVKIVNGGSELALPLTITGCLVSKSAKEKLLKAGGTVVEIREANFKKT